MLTIIADCLEGIRQSIVHHTDTTIYPFRWLKRQDWLIHDIDNKSDVAVHCIGVYT